MYKNQKKTILTVVTLALIPALTVVLSLCISHTQLMKNLELGTLDYRFAARGRIVPRSEDIKIIAFDPGSFDSISEPFILWHSYIAEVALMLVKNDAKVVGIDILQDISLEKFTPGQTRKMQMAVLTGKMVVGFLGSSKRMEYAGVGESVNLASRIEGLNKKLGTKILISEDTHNELIKSEDDLKKSLPGVEIESFGPQEVKGLEKKITVYEVRKKEW